jgi:proteic killer suppression protein
VIRSFADRDTRELWHGRSGKRLRPIAMQAARRLVALDSAASLGDLARVPGHRLEALKGDRQGQHSIRINDRWRVCFVFRDGDAHEVEIVDYH